MILLSPTEHDLQKLIPTTTYRISSLCEANGADVIVPTKKGLIAYQRKTLLDLKSSLADGRLYRELSQLKTSPILTHSFLILEHDPRKLTNDYQFMDCDFPRKNLTSVLTKVQLLGIHYLESPSTQHTVQTILDSSSYLSSTKSTTLKRPPGEKNHWGVRTNREFLAYILQSFPGIGIKTAYSFLDYFRTTIPLMWITDITELMSVPGIGKETASRLYNFFSGLELT